MMVMGSYNIAVGGRTTLNQLYENLRVNLAGRFPNLTNVKPIYRDFRAGDVRHSPADISKGEKTVGICAKIQGGREHERSDGMVCWTDAIFFGIQVIFV
jgi:hypothetical protein